MFRSMLALLPFLLSALQTNPPGDPDLPVDPKSDDVKFDEAQQKKVNDLIAAERKRTEEATAARIKAEADEAKRKADAEAERKRQEAAGEFDAVRQSLESERDTVTGERDDLKARVETLEALAAERLAALVKGLPKEIADLGPDDATPIETRLAWAEKAAKAAEKVAGTPGNGPNPKPAGNTRQDLKGVLPKRQYIN